MSFISLGLPDGVMGAAWPAVRADFAQPLAAVGVFTLTGTLCAAAASYFAGAIVKRLGTGVGASQVANGFTGLKAADTF